MEQASKNETGLDAKRLLNPSMATLPRAFMINTELLSQGQEFCNNFRKQSPTLGRRE